MMFQIMGIAAILYTEGVRSESDGDETVRISTSLGDVLGVDMGDYAVFKGVPYTQHAPTGQYRFRRSTMRSSPYNESVYNATYYRDSCTQIPFFAFADNNVSEDCLHLNIFTPNIEVTDGSGSVQDELLPVMLFIHGGGMMYGDGKGQPGDNFMANQKVIYISINYRLGSLGFFALESIYNESGGVSTGGMNGVLDQIVALEWVQSYIAEFGGDPERVTIFGESGGSWSLCYVLLSELAAGLFDQAIIQSGHCMGPYARQWDRETGVATTTELLSSSDLTDDLEELRAADALDLWSLSLYASYYNPVTLSVDGYVYEEQVEDMVNSGNFTCNANRLMAGDTNLDSITGAPAFLGGIPVIRDQEEFDEYMDWYIGNETQIEQIEQMYPVENYPSTTSFGTNVSSQSMRWTTMNADVCFVCGTHYILDELSRTQQVSDDDVFVFEFVAPDYPYYMVHGGDVVYLFDDNSTLYDSMFAVLELERKASLTAVAVDMWTNFAVYGAPNSSLSSTQEWRPWAQNSSLMKFGGENDTESVWNSDIRERCEFWNYVVGKEKSDALCLQSYVLSPTTAPTEMPTVEPTEMLTADSTADSTEDADGVCMLRSVSAGLMLVFVWIYLCL